MKTKTMRITRKIWLGAFTLMAALFAPRGAYAGPLDDLFDSIRDSLDPIRDNKTVIMSIVGVIGLILAIVAWGSNSTANDPKLTNVIKGAVLIIVLIEIFLGFV